MSLRAKILISMTLIVAALGGATVGLALLVASVRGNQAPVSPVSAGPALDIPFTDTTSFPSKPFVLNEGYVIDLVEGWELVGHTPERSVDRYRFERKADAGASILTISIYPTERTPDFDALVTARYGAAMLRQQEDVLVGSLTAKRLTAEFLDMGATSDVLIKADPKTFVSVYGIRQPDTDSQLRIAKEINFMQKSFR